MDLGSGWTAIGGHGAGFRRAWLKPDRRDQKSGEPRMAIERRIPFREIPQQRRGKEIWLGLVPRGAAPQCADPFGLQIQDAGRSITSLSYIAEAS